MFKREIKKELLGLAKDYPVVTIVGQRQAGKTTLAKSTFPKKDYVNLEEPDTREFASTDPRGFLNKYPNGAILDEIQRIPKLLSYIQAIVDQKKKKGMYILTGSHQLELHQAISQSLAGRTALLRLMPLSITELRSGKLDFPLNEYLLKGFLPAIHKDKLDPTKAYRNYMQTYIERDIRQLINIKDLNAFHRFIKLCAGRIGQVLNLNSLCNDIGISNHTAKNWLSILEASFIIFQLQPYYENLGKRIIKSPKLYFTEIGLATYLLDIENTSQIDRDPLKGNLVENLVILELLKARFNKGLDPHLYYYRDHHGNEIDVIHKQGNQLIPIEIKASETFNSRFLKGLEFLHKLAPKKCKNGYLIYAGKQSQTIHDFKIINFKDTAKIFRDI